MEETARIYILNSIIGDIFISCVNAEITPIDEDEMALRCLREDKKGIVEEDKNIFQCIKVEILKLRSDFGFVEGDDI